MTSTLGHGLAHVLGKAMAIDLARYAKTADVLLLPVNHEGHGRSLLGVVYV